MKHNIYWPAALIVLLAGCNLDENKAEKQTKSDNAPAQAPASAPANTDDTSTANLTPLEDQYLPNPGQHCYIKRLYTKNDTVFIDADYIQFYVGKAADSVATKRRDGEMTVHADGDTTWSTLDDIYILNESKKLRTLPLAKDLQYSSIYVGNQQVYRKPSSLDDLKHAVGGDGIFILAFNKNGEVSQVKQQYLP